MFCRICNKDVETACRTPTEAYMSCEVPMANPLLNPPKVEYIPEEPVYPAGFDPNDPSTFEQFVVEQTQPTNQMYTGNIPHTAQISIAQPIQFNFDDKLLELLKVSKAELIDTQQKTPTLDEIWKHAKVIADEYVVEYKPTLKRKS